MTEFEIGINEADQRLDRFLRKYLKGAPLGYIYKIIRKDVKVNGSRAKNDLILKRGDCVALYLKDEELAAFLSRPLNRPKTKKMFGVAYEDQNILAAEKPFGLLTHGDAYEKRNTLVNQVTDYLIEKGEYSPRHEKSFRPAAVNRLDRNTTGLVLFGKNSAALRDLNRMVQDKDAVGKYYITVVCGELTEEMRLTGRLTKDETRNRVSVDLLTAETGLTGRSETTESREALDIRENSGKPAVKAAGTGEAQETVGKLTEDSAAQAARNHLDQSGEGGGRYIETVIRPLVSRDGFTLTEIRLLTGRPHQIRAHLMSIGHPVAGDPKYGDPVVNRRASEKYGLTSQLLHAWRVEFLKTGGGLSYLNGRKITASLPKKQSEIVRNIFGSEWLF